MLRIITERIDGFYRLELHGSVAGEWIDVLERHWRDIRETTPGAAVSVGLSNVAFIDADGERLLRRMTDGGVTLDGDGCMTRYVIDKVSGGV